MIERWLPGVATARSYERTWLKKDVVAGVVLTALLIPAGMAYAQAAGLPPETGLYATVVPLLVYAIVGPSRILVLGPDSSLAPLIAAAIIPLAGGDADRSIALAGLLALIVGALLITGGLVGLGLITDLLSKPIRVGYLNGIAIVVVIGQLPKLLGFSVDADSLIEEAARTVEGVFDGETDTTALTIGLLSLAVIILGRVFHTRIPGVLVAVVGSVVAVWSLGLQDDLPVAGALPRGLPKPALDGLAWSDVRSLIAPALGIALIAFADTGVLSRTFAARQGRNVDGSREMAALGAANAATGLLSGFPVSASSSRTPVAEQAGAKSQLVGVVGAALILAFILLAPGVTAYLPSSTLAAVVIVAAASLVDVRGFLRLWRMSRSEAVLCLAAFLGVALVGVLEGIVVAIVLSIAAFVHKAWRPYRAELVAVEGMRGFHDVTRHPEGHRLDGTVIARFDAPLFFANASRFDDYVRSLVDGAPAPVNLVIVAAEPITSIDSTAVDELVELDEYLESHGVHLVFAEMKGPVKDQLRRLGLGDRFDLERFFTTVGAAVDAFGRRPGGPAPHDAP